jgi:hypothetical protein
VAIEARDRPLPDWFTRIRTHQTVLPRFQRFEAWGHDNNTQLFNTILRDLPIGAVLILEIGNEEPFISRPLEGAPTDGERVTEHLLDGQQRLTALWRGLHNNYVDRTYFLRLEPDEETGMPYFVESISRWQREDDKEMRPFWANKPAGLWKRRMIPLDFFSPELAAQQRFRAWAKQAIDDQEERDDVSDKVSEIRQKFSAFNLPFLSLPVGTKPETALDVFIKMNTSAAPLLIYDIVVAQVEARMDTSLHDLVGATKTACPTLAEYYPPEDLALYAGALLQGKAPTNATYLAKDFGPQLLATWDKFLAGVKRAVTFLEEERIFDAARLPSDVVVPVLTALWAVAPNSLDAEGRARLILSKYLWRAFFSDRYEKSTNSRALVDFNELKPLVTGVKGAAVPSIFDEHQHPLPDVEALVSAGWPKKKDRIGRAILAVALKHGGRDLADAGEATRTSLARREYHHLFPDAYLQRLGFRDDRIYLSLNCALVTWQTNRNISDKEPEKYLAERLDGTNVTEKQIRERLETHLIPYQEMVDGDYEKFLQKRASLIYDEMKRLCGADEGQGGQDDGLREKADRGGAAAGSD